MPEVQTLFSDVTDKIRSAINVRRNYVLKAIDTLKTPKPSQPDETCAKILKECKAAC